jgi:hypothetical protein
LACCCTQAGKKEQFHNSKALVDLHSRAFCYPRMVFWSKIHKKCGKKAYKNVGHLGFFFFIRQFSTSRLSKLALETFQTHAN